MIMESGIINPILAEASNNFMGQFVYAAIACAGGILVGLGIMAWFKRPDPTQIEQPIRTNVEGQVNVHSLDKLATRDFVQTQHSEFTRRLDGHDKDIGDLREDMKDDRKANEVHASQRSANLHGKIEAVRTDLTKQLGDVSNGVAGLRSTTELQNQTLAAVTADIKTILGRLPRQQ